jgi:hypothetical protein
VAKVADGTMFLRYDLAKGRTGEEDEEGVKEQVPGAGMEAGVENGAQGIMKRRAEAQLSRDGVAGELTRGATRQPKKLRQS